MTDYIDRQATIDALGERPMVWTSDDDYSLGERNQYDIDRLAIETVPYADVPDTNVGDMISRQAAINTLIRESQADGAYGYLDAKSIEDALERMPSVDAVEVVRCKDCKWFNDFGCAIRIVDDSDKPTENDYCSFGERKDE